MRQLFPFMLMIAFVSSAFGQQDTSRLHVNFGAGAAFLGTGDMIALHLENSLDYAVNDYFSAELSMQYGKSDYGVYVTTSYVQGNLNAFYAPFGLGGKHLFKAGTGFSFMNVSDTFKASDRLISGVLDTENYSFLVRNSYGFNIILEYMYRYSSRFSLGIELFQQHYTNSDIITGAGLKAGIGL